MNEQRAEEEKKKTKTTNDNLFQVEGELEIKKIKGTPLGREDDPEVEDKIWKSVWIRTVKGEEDSPSLSQNLASMLEEEGLEGKDVKVLVKSN